VVTNDLVVRSAPGTGRDSEVYGTIDLDYLGGYLPAFVLDGPVVADGYQWWLIVPHGFWMLGGGDWLWPGWVADGGQGDVWLEPTGLTCHDAPANETEESLQSFVCLDDAELTLPEGMLQFCGDGAGDPYPTAWPGFCSFQECYATPPDCWEVGADPPNSTIVHFDSSPAPDEADNRRLLLTGHFDDPAAEDCAVEGDPLSRLHVFRCRHHFVVTSYRSSD
jgi:hypothetical protein